MLLEYIFKTRGIDFSLYRHATIIRKLDQRLQETRTADCAEYLTYLKSDSRELDKLIRTLTIQVGNFFRNPLVFEILHTFVLPDLISKFRFLKVWSLGCADGDEPYSVAILIKDLLKREREIIDVSIVGTDICSGAIENAMRGVYPDSALKEVKKYLLEAFFVQNQRSREKMSDQERTFEVKDEIKSMVRFECDDIISRLKYGKDKETYNIILCRNVLIYMNRTLQEEILQRISEVIYKDGYLIIGAAETIPGSCISHFDQIFPGVKIFRKKD